MCLVRQPTIFLRTFWRFGLTERRPRPIDAHDAVLGAVEPYDAQLGIHDDAVDAARFDPQLAVEAARGVAVRDRLAQAAEDRALARTVALHELARSRSAAARGDARPHDFGDRLPGCAGVDLLQRAGQEPGQRAITTILADILVFAGFLHRVAGSDMHPRKCATAAVVVEPWHVLWPERVDGGAIQRFGALEGIFMPRGFKYSLESAGEEPLELLRVGATALGEEGGMVHFQPDLEQTRKKVALEEA